jgi:uncharacterized membrane protein (TIGR02234 family)
VSGLGRPAGRGPVLAVLLLGAGVGFLACAQPWWRTSGDAAAATFSGSDATGGLGQALAAVTLAGTLLVLVLRSRGRRVLALLLAATGLGMIVAGARQSAPAADSVRSRVRQVSLTDRFALDVTGWPWAYATAGLLVLTGAALLWWGAPRWADRGARFDRAGSASPGRAADLNEDPGRAWKDLDAGLDPTFDPAERSGDPDVRPASEGDTMSAGDTTERSHDHRRE